MYTCSLSVFLSVSLFLCLPLCLPPTQSVDVTGGGVTGSQEEWGEPLERCMHCFRDFPLSVLVNHSAKCTGDMLGSRERFKGFLPSIHDVRNFPVDQ